MTTTSHFQKLPDYYTSIEECKKKRHKIVSNPRYGKKGFYQTHFTAGDEYQFQEYRDKSNGQVCIPKIKLKNNKFYGVDFSLKIDWLKYQNLNATAVDNTFSYMFNKFKKGIFVKIQDNQLRVFLPFSKANFVNEWGDKIKVDPKFGNMYNFSKYINKLGKKKFKVSVNKYSGNWYANNCLIRYEFPVNEGDTNVPIMSDMLKTLCSHRKVPDIEFFINRRDFPVIKKNETEAYDDIFGDDHPLVSHKYDQYSPILSMVTSDKFADIPIPTGDDWGRVSSFEGKFFDRGCRSYPSHSDFNIKWENKKPTAVFRGASTGCGVKISTNIRLKLAYMSANQTSKKGEPPLLDAGISKWQLRPRKLKEEKYLQTIDVSEMNRRGISLASFVTPYEQSGYKYIIHVDGHVSAFRLSLEMSMGSTILLAESPYRIWFRSMLKPMIHYIPIKSDLSDLIEKIKWCRANDEKCKRIAKNAKKFYLEYLQKDGVLDYLQKLIIDLKNRTGLYLYNEESPLARQVRLEENLDNSYPPTNKKVSNIGLIPRQSRSYGILKGLEWVINLINKETIFSNIAKKGDVIFTNKSKTVVVQEYSLAGYSFAVKDTKDSSKQMENIHETFVGKNAINEIVKYIPNFAYVFGKYGKSNVIIERIHGMTFNSWIESDKFSMKNFIFILIQIAFALEVAQRHCGFVHYDLTPWNIIIQELPKNISFDYMIDYENVFRINTNIIPVIIDYGKCHVFHKNVHHGFVNMYKTSTIQDIISILITSLNSVINSKLSGKDAQDVIKLANFIAGKNYNKKQSFRYISDLKYFFKNATKYTELISSDKHELEKLTPMDFIDYVKKNIKYSFPINKTNYPVFRINKGNPRQVFDYILASTDLERVESFTNVFKRILDCQLPKSGNLFFDYYTAQTLEDNISSVNLLMMRYIKNSTIVSVPNENLYTLCMNKIKKHYEIQLSQKVEHKIQYDLEGYRCDELEIAPYTEKTFLLPDVILNLLGKYEKESKMLNISEYQFVIEKTLLNEELFKLSKKHKEYYLKNFRKLLSTNRLNIQNNISNAFTLYETARGIYTKDKNFLLSKLEKQRNKDKKIDCSLTEKYIKFYYNIECFF